jgi:4-amino-4-deoxy-L-arabinose transferase-like glycosyltransferase
VLVAAAALRVWLLTANYPLHHDEALYGAWAQLIVSGRDPLLLTAWVDKPPLVIYALAASLRLFGVSELALRLPGMLVSLATIVCVYGLARRLYDARTALLASLLLALAPFAILFAPTTFTDPWLTLWLVAAVWAAVARRSFWAGVALGLAVASKQQGVLGAPLVAALLLAGDALGSGAGARPSIARRPRRAALARFGLALLGFALVFLPVTYWDSLRWAKRPSFWDRSLTTYGGLGLAPLAAWPERATEWAQVAGYLFGLPVLSASMLGLAGFAAIRDWRWMKAGGLLGIFLAGYGILHLALTFQPWDRYLLPLLPLICVLAARGIGVLLCHAERAYGSTPIAAISQRSISLVGRRAVVIALVALMGWAAWLGATARLPVGSDHGAYTGLDRIAAFLRAQDADAVIYQRWIGWHFDFYLFDAPQERRWWGAGWKLAGDAARTDRETPGRSQWVVLPGWHDAVAGEVRLALASRSLALAEVQRIYRADGSRAFTVYRIVPDDAVSAPGFHAEAPGGG